MDKQVYIRVSPNDKQRLTDIAKAKNLTISHLIRNILIEQGLLSK
jgi:predicted DNA-binding protein